MPQEWSSEGLPIPKLFGAILADIAVSKGRAAVSPCHLNFSD